MNRSETLIEIQRLLQQYVGVTIDFTMPLPGATRIVFRINDQTSLARIVYCAGAANVATHVWSGIASSSDADRSNYDHLRYELWVPHEAECDDPPNTLEILGINLVWDLARRSILGRDDANRLLDTWKGARV